MDLSFISNIFLYAIYCIRFYFALLLIPSSIFFSWIFFLCLLACSSIHSSVYFWIYGRLLNHKFIQFHFIPYQFRIWFTLFFQFSTCGLTCIELTFVVLLALVSSLFFFFLKWILERFFNLIFSNGYVYLMLSNRKKILQWSVKKVNF